MTTGSSARGPRRSRRTQEERSSETRRLLLDATIDSLAELGYLRTTAQRVANRAGLSRGAQLHHFGSKAALVTAAMEHLFERSIVEFQTALENLPVGADRVPEALDALWAILKGPTGAAYMELAWASRTDLELQETMTRVNRRIDARIEEMFRDMFPDAFPSDATMVGVAWTAIFAVLEGLAFERTVRRDDERIDQVIQLLRQLLPAILVPGGEPSK